MISFIAKHKLTLAGLLLGALGGYLYYHFIGCNSGSCPITSRPLNSTAYGAVMGWLLFSGFEKSPAKQPESNESQPGGDNLPS
jgi:hypothetical protein